MIPLKKKLSTNSNQNFIQCNNLNNIFQAKKEIYSVKEERLILAQDEYQHLTDTLTGWKSSRTSRKLIK